MVASRGRTALSVMDAARLYAARFYRRLAGRGKQYGQSRRDYIGQARTGAEAAKRMAAATVDCSNVSSGTRRKWARTVARVAQATA